MAEALKPYNFESELVPVKDYDDSANFVAITCEVDDNGHCYHAGLLVHYEKELIYFHFGGKEVLIENISKQLDTKPNLFYKKLEVVKEEEVETFLWHCEVLKKKGVSPLYGFVFNDSYYDSLSKESFLVNTVYDITTCVGFCLKVIRGFLHNHVEYIKLEDWSAIVLEDAPQQMVNYMNKYLAKYAAEEKITINDLYHKGELKRVFPAELLTSTFFTRLPIEKKEIDVVCPLVESFLIKIKAA